MFTLEEVNRIFADEIGRAILAGLPLPANIRQYPSVQLGNYTRALGKCSWCGISYGEKQCVVIHLSKYMLQTTEWDIRNVLAHELCHACPGRNHGTEFKHWARLLNNRYGYTIATRASVEESLNFAEAKSSLPKYRITCKKCGYTITKERMCKCIKYPYMYTHTGCGGEFERS